MSAWDVPRTDLLPAGSSPALLLFWRMLREGLVGLADREPGEHSDGPADRLPRGTLGSSVRHTEILSGDSKWRLPPSPLVGCYRGRGRAGTTGQRSNGERGEGEGEGWGRDGEGVEVRQTRCRGLFL